MISIMTLYYCTRFQYNQRSITRNTNFIDAYPSELHAVKRPIKKIKLSNEFSVSPLEDFVIFSCVSFKLFDISVLPEEVLAALFDSMVRNLTSIYLKVVVFSPVHFCLL